MNTLLIFCFLFVTFLSTHGGGEFELVGLLSGRHVVVTDGGLLKDLQDKNISVTIRLSRAKEAGIHDLSSATEYVREMITPFYLGVNITDIQVGDLGAACDAELYQETQAVVGFLRAALANAGIFSIGVIPVIEEFSGGPVSPFGAPSPFVLPESPLPHYGRFLSHGALAGIVIGSILGGAGMVAGGFCIFLRKKATQERGVEFFSL